MKKDAATLKQELLANRELWRVRKLKLRMTEGVIAGILAIIVPMLAPVAVAQITFEHLRSAFDLKVAASGTAAFTIEALGFVIVSYIFRLKTRGDAIDAMAQTMRNKTDKATITAKKPPVVWAYIAFGMYYIITVSVNTLAIIQTQYIASGAYDYMQAAREALPSVLSAFFLASLTVPAAIVSGLSVANAQLDEEVSALREELDSMKVSRKVSKGKELSEKVSESFQKVSDDGESFPEVSEKVSDWRKLSEGDMERLRELAAWSDRVAAKRQVAKEYPVTEKTAGNWLKNFD